MYIDDEYKQVQRMHDKWLNEPEPEKFMYRVRVEVTQYYDVDVEAENEESAYEEASAVVYNEAFPQGCDLYDEDIAFVSCEEI